jgi:hypothetical protein
MKGADRCYKDHRYVDSRWQRREFRSRLHSPSPLSRRRPYPRRRRVVMRPTGGPTAVTDLRIRVTGITQSGVPAGTTATQPPAGIRLPAGRRPRTGLRPRAGIPRPAGLHRRGGSDLVPDHSSICSTHCAARSPRSKPAPGWGQAQSRSKIELMMSPPMPMPAPVMAGRSAVRSAASRRHEGPRCG